MDPKDVEQIRNRFKEGTIVYHKATHDKCVVITVTTEGQIKVRTQHNVLDHYFAQELETEAELISRTQSQMPKNKFDDLDPYGL